jgi:hypothetical protein
MPVWDILKRDVREFFTSPRVLRARRQCEFHLKVAETLVDGAFGKDDAAWQEYFDELGRAIAANVETIEARYLRSRAARYWFEALKAPSSDPKVREMARIWDRDLKYLLTNFPDKEPEGMSLRGAREMRQEFERLCRGVKL